MYLNELNRPIIKILFPRILSVRQDARRSPFFGSPFERLNTARSTARSLSLFLSSQGLPSEATVDEEGFKVRGDAFPLGCSSEGRRRATPERSTWFSLSPGRFPREQRLIEFGNLGRWRKASKRTAVGGVAGVPATWAKERK